MKSWKKHNPDFNIILITKENYPDYVYIDPGIANHPKYNDFIQRFADLIRIFVLEKHGGYWMDASILLKAPLSTIMFHKKKDAEFSGFYLEEQTTDPRYPILENWMFACTPDSRFVSLWKKEFLEIRKYLTVEDYVESRRKLGVDLQKQFWPEYLTMNVSAQKVLQIDKYPLSRLEIQKAEDGPYSYLIGSEWNPSKALERACKNDNNYKILKLRSHERNFLDQQLSSHLSQEKCRWV